MRLKRSPWISGAVLSSVALLCHGSGAINLDGLNPLLAAGCAHQPGSRLTVRSKRLFFKKSVTLKASHRIQLTLKDGSTVEGLFVEKTDEPATGRRPEVAPDRVLFVPASPSIGRRITLQLGDGSVQQVPIAQIRSIGFNHPRDGWKYVRIGALVGAVPMATLAFAYTQTSWGLMNGQDAWPTIQWMTFCAGLGAVPGGAAGGLVYGVARLVPTDSVTMQLGPDWELE